MAETPQQPPQSRRAPHAQRRAFPAGFGLLHLSVQRDLLVPTAIALVGFVVALLTKHLLGFADLVINHGLGAGAIAQIALFRAVPIAAQTLPFAVLVGTLAGLGRMAADGEIVALRSLGTPARALALPAAGFGLAAGLLGLALAWVATPWAAESLGAALTELARAVPAADLRAGVVRRFGEHRLHALEVADAGRELRGVSLWSPELDDAIFAERGSLQADATGLTLELHSGSVLLAPEAGARWLGFREIRARLPRDALLDLAETQGELAPLASAELRALADFGDAAPGLARRAAQEWQRRSALPLAAPLFAVLAVPLALLRPRLTRSSGAVMGVLVTLVYYGLLQLAGGLVQSGALSPALGEWLPNGVLALACAIGLRRADAPPSAGIGFGLGWPRGWRGFRAPHHALDWYVGGAFLRAVLLAFAALLVAYLIVDVLERLDWFARYRATLPEALRFYGLRIWLLASRVVPMALLLGAALLVGRFISSGELVAMRACGIPAARGFLPVVVVALLATGFSFALNDWIVPRTNAGADRIKNRDIKHLPEETVRSGVFYREGDTLVRIGRLDEGAGVAEQVTLYGLGPSGLPLSRSDAAAARYTGGGRWELQDARAVEISSDGPRDSAAPDTVALGEEPSAAADAMHFSAAGLAGVIADVEREGLDARRFRVDLQVRLAAPVACLVLPVLVLFLALGSTAPGSARILLVAAILGVGYVLLTGVTAALGYGGVLSPLLAGWALPVTLGSAGAAMAIRNRH